MIRPNMPIQRITAHSPHGWQERGWTCLKQYGDKCIYNCATGTGKTYFAIEWIKELLSHNPFLRILVLCPKNVICDNWIVEFEDNGFSPLDICKHYSGGRDIGRITITNMQSITKFDRNQLREFDVLVADETHWYASDKLLRIMDENFPKKIGLTASLERMDGKEWDILNVFDYNRFDYTLREAIIDGVVNTFHFYAIGVTMDPTSMDEYKYLTNEIKAMSAQYGGHKRLITYFDEKVRNRYLGLFTTRKKLVNNYSLKNDEVLRIISEDRNKKTLIFSEFNDTTTRYYWDLLGIDEESEVVHSGITQQRRHQNIERFKNDDINILLATKVIDEGWNVPACERGIITANTANARQVIQRLGRILRKKDDPSVMYYLFCRDTIEENYMKEYHDTYKKVIDEYNDVYGTKLECKVIWK